MDSKAVLYRVSHAPFVLPEAVVDPEDPTPCFDHDDPENPTVSFWTSTTSTRPAPTGNPPETQGRRQAFIVNFYDGKIHNDEVCNDKDDDVGHFVWPVRRGGD